MGSTLETVVFYFLAAFIIAMSIMTVTTQRIVRSATYLLFVLFGTAGIYFLLQTANLAPQEISIHAIGNALLSSDKYGYVLPFEAVSILLLACIIGGIMIARKR